MVSRSQGLSSDDLYSLLNHAFDGWGSQEYFDWKYNSFPSYDPNKDNFTISNDGRVVAARRIFRRQLVLPSGETVPVHIHGGTVVHKEYRQKGYYSDLLNRSIQHSKSEATHIFTFNRDGKITTEHHRTDGWEQILLPVYVKILSPSTVFNEYILNSRIVDRIITPLSPIERQVVRSRIISRIIARCAGAVYGGRESIYPPITASKSDYKTEILTENDISEGLLTEISEQLASRSQSKYNFARSPETIRHCISYPGCRVFLARREGTDHICAFVITGTLKKGDLRECRVLEHMWSDPDATQVLYGMIEEHAQQSNVDAIVTCSPYKPGTGWIPMDTEYMMWPDQNNTRLPASKSLWRITTYDIL